MAIPFCRCTVGSVPCDHGIWINPNNSDAEALADQTLASIGAIRNPAEPTVSYIFVPTKPVPEQPLWMYESIPADPYATQTPGWSSGGK